jgi:hypothetical protein
MMIEVRAMFVRWMPALAVVVPILLLGEPGCVDPTIQPPPPLAPIAAAVVEILDDEGRTVQRSYAHRPAGSTVQLDGTGSYDPERGSASAGTLEFEWSFIETPTGVDPDLSFPHSSGDGTDLDPTRPVFVAADLGTYRVALVVTDPQDDTSSSPDYVTIGATVPADLVIDLYWATPATDLDLHLIAPGGTYWDDGDCFYANPSPDWGLAGSSPDNPVLEQDDDNGGEEVSPGHERIQLPGPQQGRYTVVVVHHSDHGSHQGAIPWLQLSTAEGIMVERLDCPQELAGGDAWIAVEIDIPSLAVTPVDDLTSHEGLGGPEVNQ